MRLEIPTTSDGLSHFWRAHERQIQILALVAGLGSVILVAAVWVLSGDLSDVGYWRKLGYAGVFLLSFIGSVSLVLPVPGLIAVCGAGSIQFFLIGVALLASTGETLGEISGYAIGYGGRSVIENRGFYERVKGWMERRGSTIIFLVSVIPNPAFDIVGIVAGGSRFPLKKFLAIVWVGKTIKALVVVHTCFWIAQWLPWI